MSVSSQIFIEKANNVDIRMGSRSVSTPTAIPIKLLHPNNVDINTYLNNWFYNEFSFLVLH